MQIWEAFRKFVLLTASIFSDVLIVWCILVDKNYQTATFYAVMGMYLYSQYKEIK